MVASSAIDSPEDRLSNDVSIDLSFVTHYIILDCHLDGEVRREIEEFLNKHGARKASDLGDATVVLGKFTARRARLELQWKGVLFDKTTEQKEARAASNSNSKQRKRRKVPEESMVPETGFTPGGSSAKSTRASTTDSDSSDTDSSSATNKGNLADESCAALFRDLDKDIIVLHLDWIFETQRLGRVLSPAPYILLRGQPKARPQPKALISSTVLKASTLNQDAIRNLDQTESGTSNLQGEDAFKKQMDHKGGADIRQESVSASKIDSKRPLPKRPVHLLHQTTSEHDDAESGRHDLPEMPDWIVHNKLYSCERATPRDSPNDDFIAKLKKIRLARLLTMDEIGVRAYSTSIASIAAYPHRLQSSAEVLALPGCEQKIAHLFREYQQHDGVLQEVVDAEQDAVLKVLRLFYEIWGVGAVTARSFYFEKGWRDLDDIVQYGWSTLSRVQQIGVKYYDEFLVKIPQQEVETIAAKIHMHAARITDSSVQTIIVGGHRRGKAESGDVDVILSHPENELTQDLVTRVVASLEEERYVTHLLTLDLSNSKRNQAPHDARQSLDQKRGNFDALDKALVVWQDPVWPDREQALAKNPNAKNPNIHRRVDIIISPWRTVGCAVLGWTSGTTFQRDLRLHARKTRGWVFDSSGIRDASTGEWLDVESWTDPKTRCRTWQEAEKRVFERLGLTYRAPDDRCTG